MKIKILSSAYKHFTRYFLKILNLFFKISTNFLYEKEEEKFMARIIEGKRRVIRMTVNDVMAVIRQYQFISRFAQNYSHTRELLAKADFCLPEDV